MNADLRAIPGATSKYSRQQAVPLYEMVFSDWEPGHYHWRGPSKIMIMEDGAISVTVGHLSNHQRQVDFINTGMRVYAIIDVSLYDNDRGPPFFSFPLTVAALEFARPINGIVLVFNFPNLIPAFNRSKWAKFGRRWEKNREKPPMIGPGTVYPVPEIPGIPPNKRIPPPPPGVPIPDWK